MLLAMIFIVREVREIPKQVARKILLYNFNVMKAWIENLLTYIPQPKKNNILHLLHLFMHLSK